MPVYLGSPRPPFAPRPRATPGNSALRKPVCQQYLSFTLRPRALPWVGRVRHAWPGEPGMLRAAVRDHTRRGALLSHVHTLRERRVGWHLIRRVVARYDYVLRVLHRRALRVSVGPWFVSRALPGWVFEWVRASAYRPVGHRGAGV